MNHYRINDYRIEPGHYETQHHTIYRSMRTWQLRDTASDTILEEYTTLRSALSAALRYDERINERRAVAR